MVKEIFSKIKVERRHDLTEITLGGDIFHLGYYIPKDNGQSVVAITKDGGCRPGGYGMGLGVTKTLTDSQEIVIPVGLFLEVCIKYEIRCKDLNLTILNVEIRYIEDVGRYNRTLYHCKIASFPSIEDEKKYAIMVSRKFSGDKDAVITNY